jgi:hypothetical protein
MMPSIINVDDVIGVDVKNNQNEDLGEIEALMLDKPTGKVAYVVLSFGGFLGMGNKLFALPWEIFSYDKSAECFKAPVSKEQLKDSPGFDKDNWPDMSNQQWRDSIRTHYNTM